MSRRTREERLAEAEEYAHRATELLDPDRERERLVTGLAEILSEQLDGAAVDSDGPAPTAAPGFELSVIERELLQDWADRHCGGVPYAYSLHAAMVLAMADGASAEDAAASVGYRGPAAVECCRRFLESRLNSIGAPDWWW